MLRSIAWVRRVDLDSELAGWAVWLFSTGDSPTSLWPAALLTILNSLNLRTISVSCLRETKPGARASQEWMLESDEQPKASMPRRTLSLIVVCMTDSNSLAASAGNSLLDDVSQSTNEPCTWAICEGNVFFFFYLVKFYIILMLLYALSATSRQTDRESTIL